MVEAAIGEVEAEQILPIDPCPYRIGSLAVGQTFPELEQRDERQAHWRLGGLTLAGEEVGEIGIAKEHIQLVIHAHDKVAGWKDGSGNASGFFWDAIDGLRL
jgi:hypothetical protein